jgi:hypothetical protein
MAYIGQGLTEGVRQVYTYIASTGQTIFPASYDIGQLDVYVNGILLLPADYTALTGTTVIVSGIQALDEITIVSHNLFSVANTVSSATGGTFNGPVKFASGLIENNTHIPANYTISANYNALSGGPITIDSDVSVNIPNGSAWVIV